MLSAMVRPVRDVRFSGTVSDPHRASMPATGHGAMTGLF